MKHPKMLHITRAHKNVKVHRGVPQMCILVILITELAWSSAVKTHHKL